MDKHKEGYTAYELGLPLTDNPFEWTNPEDADQWEAGWRKALEDDGRMVVGAGGAVR